MMMKQSFKIGVAAGLLIMATAACGVKSTPDFPEGATYPRVYPALKDQTKGAGAEVPATTRTGVYGSTYTRQTRRNSGDEYTPPPPATELLVK